MRLPLTIEEARCVHRIAAVAGCRACVQACPRSAWRIDADGLGFDEARCDRCGLCVAACPTDALALPLPWPVPRRAPDGVGTVTLRCELDAGVAGDGTPLPCIHAVDEAQLLRWHAQGALRVDADMDSCASCPRRPTEGLPDRLRRLSGALRGRGQPLLYLVHGGARRASPAAAAAATTVAAAPVGLTGGLAAPPAGAQPPPDRQRRGLLGLRGAASPSPVVGVAPLRRLQALRHLARLGPGPALWAVELEPGRCDACRACARLCPTQAIAEVSATTPAGGGGALTFEMARCVGCGVCVDACEPRALSPSASGRLGSARRGWALTLVNCRNCGKGYAALAAQPGVASRCPSCRAVGARRSDRVVQIPSAPLAGAKHEDVA